MTYKATILNFTAGVFTFGIATYTAFNFRELSAGSGWGILGMFVLIITGLALLAIDFVLQQIFKNRATVNIIGVCILIATPFLLPVILQ